MFARHRPLTVTVALIGAIGVLQYPMPSTTAAPPTHLAIAMNRKFLERSLD